MIGATVSSNGYRILSCFIIFKLARRMQHSSANFAMPGDTLRGGTSVFTRELHFKWPRSEVFVSTVVVQNFPPDLIEVPAEVKAVFGAESNAELLPAGRGGRRKRSDVRVQLTDRIAVGRLEVLTAQLRERLRYNPSLAARAEAVEVAPETGALSMASVCGAAAGTVVVDTDAISLIFKGHTRATKLAKFLECPLRKLIAFQTVAELHAWVMLRGFSKDRIRELELMLCDYEVVFPDDITCLIWAVLNNYCNSHGRPGGSQDLWVAATALRHGAYVCTGNVKDYDYLPWLTFLNQDLLKSAVLPEGTSLLTEHLVPSSTDYRWPQDEVLVSSVVIQNFATSMLDLPEEITMVFGDKIRTTLMQGGKTGRRKRNDWRVELTEKCSVFNLGVLQSRLRELMHSKCDDDWHSDVIEIVPEEVCIASQPIFACGIVLADTNALSSIFKAGRCGSELGKVLQQQERKLVAFQTVAELYALVVQRCFREERICRLEALLKDFEVVYPDDLTCLVWAGLMNYCRAHAQPSDARAIWVAALALRHGACICTSSKEAYTYLPGLCFL